MDGLKKIEPSLELQGRDQRLLHICCADFKNYSDYLEENSMNSEGIMPSSVAMEVDLTTGDYRVEENDETEEIVEFVQMWVKGWRKKYLERVQITVKKFPSFKSSKTRERGARMMSNFSKEEIDGIKKAIVRTLIKNGEICCTDILTDASFKAVLGRYSKEGEWTPEKKLNFMSSIIREVKRMSHTRGVLVFIKPDKRYYELREFRDDSPQPL